MGTNYYWRDKPCKYCGRYEEIHLSKGQYLWQAYLHRLLTPEFPENGYDPESPFGFPVLSLAHWRRIFTERPGELWDEYGRQVNDPLAWLAEAEPWEPDPIDGRKRLDRDIAEGEGWLDSEGFRFSARWFS